MFGEWGHIKKNDVKYDVATTNPHMYNLVGGANKGKSILIWYAFLCQWQA